MLNQIILEGNLGADAEMRQVSSELFAIQFSLAQTQEARNEKRTMWLRCDLLRNNAESATKTVAVLKKGRRVVVVGQLLDDSYEKSGEKIKALKVRVEKFHLMDAPSEANQAQGQASSQVAKQTQATQATQAVIANDLPF